MASRSVLSSVTSLVALATYYSFAFASAVIALTFVSRDKVSRNYFVLIYAVVIDSRFTSTLCLCSRLRPVQTVSTFDQHLCSTKVERM